MREGGERDSGRSCLTIEVSSDTSVGPLAAVGQTALTAALKPLTVLCSGVGGGGRLGAGDILKGEKRREMVGEVTLLTLECSKPQSYSCCGVKLTVESPA